MSEVFPNASFEGERQPQKTGDFEVYVNGELASSKKESKKFPDMGEELAKAIKSKL